MYLANGVSIRVGECAERNVLRSPLTAMTCEKVTEGDGGLGCSVGGPRKRRIGLEGYPGVGIAYCRTSLGSSPDRQRTASTEPSCTEIRPSPVAPPLGLSWSMASKA
jgi:hypothetical protein